MNAEQVFEASKLIHARRSLKELLKLFHPISEPDLNADMIPDEPCFRSAEIRFQFLGHGEISLQSLKTQFGLDARERVIHAARMCVVNEAYENLQVIEARLEELGVELDG